MLFGETSQVGTRVVGALELRLRRLVGSRTADAAVRVDGHLRHLLVETSLDAGERRARFGRGCQVPHYRTVFGTWCGAVLR